MITLKKAKRVYGHLRVPSDKSLSHRAVIFGSIAKGTTKIKNFLYCEDTLATLRAFKLLGVKVKEFKGVLIIEGRNYEFSEPPDVIDAKNSGTTARLLLGVLATQNFFSVLTGDESLRRRPMDRVVKPLTQMGAKIWGRKSSSLLPLAVVGGKLKGINFFNEKSSAQVKSSLLLAGLRCEGKVIIEERFKSRDHTERLIEYFGGKVKVKKNRIELKGGQSLEGRELKIPADPSSASFFIALTFLIGGELILEDVLINPTRIGFLKKVEEMGGRITFLNKRVWGREEVADLIVKGPVSLRGVEVLPEEVPYLIDEVPVLAILMALARGRSSVRGAKELRFKESDRIRAICENLRAMGVKVEEYEDGFELEGSSYLKGTKVRTYKDHRIAMAFAVAGLVAEGETTIDHPECVSISYPNFFEDLRKITTFSSTP